MGQGFVHQQHRGLHRQSAGQQHPLALATRQLPQGALAQIPALGLAHHGLHHGMVLGAGALPPTLVGQSAQHHHVQSAHIVIAIGGLAQPSQLLGAELGGHGFAVYPHNSHIASGGQQTGQGFEQCGFARTIRANDAGPTPTRKRHIQGVQHSAPTQGHLQATGS
jgi:hypothetical protein